MVSSLEHLRTNVMITPEFMLWYSTALTQKIPQMNNFVIYDGFFAAHQSEKENPIKGSQMHIAAR